MFESRETTIFRSNLSKDGRSKRYYNDKLCTQNTQYSSETLPHEFFTLVSPR